MSGTHADWAVTSQDRLAEMIAEGLPKKLEEARAKIGAPLNLSAMDAAFQAGSEGGPTRTMPGDIEVAGLPGERPKWIVPAVAAGLAILAIIIVWVAVR